MAGLDARGAGTLDAASTDETGAARSARSKTPPSPEALRDVALASLDDDKAREVVTIDLRGKSSIGDFMIVASGTSPRHVGAMAQKLERRFKEAGQGPRAIEGLPQADWVLIDAGDVIVHLFRPEVRQFYQLEKMWGVALPEPKPVT